MPTAPVPIRHIWMVEGLSRDHVLRYWDGEQAPSVEVPAPDFFAVGHERFAPVNSQMVAVNPANSLNCFWPMPFRRHAKITFTNQSDKELRLLAYQITYSLGKIPRNTAYFHAQWRQADTRTQNPYVILDGVQGRGEYAGTFLAWTQQTDNNWFGEGEIKFFIDGDREFPTSPRHRHGRLLPLWKLRVPAKLFGALIRKYDASRARGRQPSQPLEPLPLARARPDYVRERSKSNHPGARLVAQCGKQIPQARRTTTCSSVAYWYQQSDPHAPFPAWDTPEQNGNK